MHGCWKSRVASLQLALIFHCILGYIISFYTQYNISLISILITYCTSHICVVFVILSASKTLVLLICSSFFLLSPLVKSYSNCIFCTRVYLLHIQIFVYSIYSINISLEVSFTFLDKFLQTLYLLVVSLCWK